MISVIEHCDRPPCVGVQSEETLPAKQLAEFERAEQIRKGQRRTSAYMTLFEKSRLLGMRAAQLADSAPATVPIRPGKRFDPLEVAMEELKNGSLPLLIRRQLPNGKSEIWRPEELEVPK